MMHNFRPTIRNIEYCSYGFVFNGFGKKLQQLNRLEFSPCKSISLTFKMRAIFLMSIERARNQLLASCMQE